MFLALTRVTNIRCLLRCWRNTRHLLTSNGTLSELPGRMRAKARSAEGAVLRPVAEESFTMMAMAVGTLADRVRCTQQGLWLGTGPDMSGPVTTKGNRVK